MHIDTNDLDDGASLECDICIVGSGPAGSILAESLSSSGLKVTVLEGGGREFELNSHALYAGHTTGNVVASSSYLTHSRMRLVGGTSNHWSGWCRTLSPVDFEEREWIPYSGWPISWADVVPYYKRAAEYLGFQFPGAGADGRQLPAPILFGRGDEKIQTSFFDISPLTNKLHHIHGDFQNRYWRLFKRNRKVSLVIHANVVRLQADENAKRVKHAVVRTFSNKTMTVRAKHFVLAAGGIENPRLLLASNDVAKAGLGNDRDLVGRFFMEHPHIAMAGRLLFVNGPKSLNTFKHYKDGKLGQMGLGVLCPSESALREDKLLNFCAQLDLSQQLADVHTDLGNAVAQTARRISSVQSPNDDMPCTSTGKQAEIAGRTYLVPLLLRTEQAPNPDSRVTLHPTQRDYFDVPFPLLNWELKSIDYDGCRRALEVLGREVARTGIGRLQVVHEHLEAPGIIAGGYHHMGTTRMHSDPKKGVCDSNCRVHGIDNLSICGCSLFVTGGVSNPTFTIAALAVRLADHLRELLKNPV